MLILLRIVQGFQKYIWLVYQTEIWYRYARIERLDSVGYFLIFDKIFATWLSCSIRAHRYEIWVDPSSTLKNNFHSGRRLIDKPDIFLESLDDSEQIQHRCIFNFIFKIFWVEPLPINRFW